MKRSGSLLVVSTEPFVTHKDRERRISQLKQQYNKFHLLDVDRGSGIFSFQYEVSEFDGMKRIVY